MVSSRRINVCHEALYKGMEFAYRFECNIDNNMDTNGHGVSAILRRWYMGNTCMGDVVHTEYYSTDDIVDYVCSSDNICDDNDVLMFKNYHNKQCKVDMDEYTVSDVLTEQCFMDNNNGSKYIE
eukprot:TRINITY_DN1996_c0_g1_i1.p1 TRINITY_DN1996_c0_g1~~TRINITY_DN1996_c0_g1_i1.p1  ORF type:complete len:124 (-),score=43.30 TRINITY_DN1996_c0_g1_i1:10-381(-)